MKSIIVHAFDDEGFENRLQVALDLARTFEAHVGIVYAIPVEASVPGDFYGAAFAAMVPVWREAADKLRESTIKDLGNEDIAWDWLEVGGSSSSVLLHHSALCDLIIVGAREPHVDGRRPSATVGDLAMHARCPVLVVPDGLDRFDASAPVLIGWDGSAEASHALRAAMPLLKRASRVFLAYVDEGSKARAKLDLPPTQGAAYLSRHGVDCEIVELPPQDRKVSRVLRDAAQQRKCGLVVMGAYGHWRLAERVFGGATRDMLSDVTLPVFMTH